MTLFNEKVKGYISHGVYSIVLVLFFLLQSSGLATFKLFGVFPQLMLVFTVFAGFFFREYSGIVYGFVSGLLLDSISTGIFGFNTIVLAFIGFACGITMTYLLNNNFISAVVTSFGFTFLYFLLKWLFFSVFVSDSPSFFLVKYFFEAIYTSVLGIIIYLLFRFIFIKFSNLQR